MNQNAENKRFAVMILSGVSDNGWRAIMGFTFISTLITYGHHVTVFFGGEGTVWVKKNPPQIHHPPFKSPTEILDEIIDLDNVELIICTNCSEACAVDGADDPGLREDIPLGGMSTIMHQVVQGDVLTF